jgi:hypothetical protein
MLLKCGLNYIYDKFFNTGIHEAQVKVIAMHRAISDTMALVPDAVLPAMSAYRQSQLTDNLGP